MINDELMTEYLYSRFCWELKKCLNGSDWIPYSKNA